MGEHDGLKCCPCAWWEVRNGAGQVSASCPTREAAEAALRLLSGECERAKDEPPLPVCGVCLDTQTRSDGHMCTACPVPCDKCRDGNRPYCRETRCDCDCHERRGRAMGEVVRTVRWPEWVPSSECSRRYNEGKADGAAQERARIVALLRAAHPWSLAWGLANTIERGEAGE